MSIRNINTVNGAPVQASILTVAELAEHLKALIQRGQGDLPVFSSDGRASFPFEMVVPYTPSGYPECLLVKPQPHLHAEARDLFDRPASYFDHINAEADRIREVCGAFA